MEGPVDVDDFDRLRPVITGDQITPIQGPIDLAAIKILADMAEKSA